MDTKTVLNFILREMFRRADLIDLYSLADPNRCSRYIVVAASSLEQLFIKQNLEPKRGKDGVFYFQNLEGLKKAMPQAMRDQQQKNCTDLAFFFIRIFQIYAAMTLSILDSELPQIDPAILAPTPRARKGSEIFLQPPGLAGFPQQPEKKPGIFGMFKGGALSRDEAGRAGSYYLASDLAGPYKLLNRYLVAPAEGRRSLEDMRFENNNTLRIPQSSLYTFIPAGTNVNANANDREPLDRRVKAFTEDDTLVPEILYMYKRGDEVRTLLADLKLETEDVRTKVLLTVKAIRPARPGFTRQEFKGELTAFTSTNTRPTTAKGKELPALILEFMDAALAKADPAPFSAVEFLKKHKIMSTLDENTGKIEGTKIFVENLRSTPVGEVMGIVYKDRMKLEEREREILLKTKLQITKLPRTSAVEDQKYRVSVDLEGMSTTPSSLKSMMDYPTKATYREFTTKENDTATPVSEKGEYVGAYLKGVFERLLKGVTEEGFSRSGIQYTRAGLPKPFDTPEIPEPLRIKKIWEALAKDPPVKAHCVARAVQLLNVATIRGDTSAEAYSSVCKLKFPFAADGSLPIAGKPITEEYGIYALSQLFFDKVIGNSPRISESEKFKEMTRKLKASFERMTGEVEPPMPTTLQDIDEKSMYYCRGHADDRLKVDGPLVGTLRAKAMELLGRQAKHVRNIMKIMFSLFNEKQIRAGVLEIHPKVLAGGMEAVNRVAEDARSVLIEYYSDCEKTFKDGLFAIHEYKQKQPTGDLSWRPDPVFSSAPAARPASGPDRNTNANANKNNNNNR